MLVGGAAIVAACASWPAVAAAPDDLATYLKARAADADGQEQAALVGYAQALSARPDDAVIALRAYQEALAAGDDTLLARATQTLIRADQMPPGTVLLQLADAIRDDDAKRQDTALAAIAKSPFAFMAPSLEAWRGFNKSNRYVAPKTLPAASALTKRYDEENVALLAIASGDTAGGAAAVRAILTADRSRRGLARDAAALLVGAADSDTARTLVGTGPLPLPEKPSFGFGVSRIYIRLAEDLASGDPNPLTVLLARAALTIDPTQDAARLVLARALARQDDDQRALATLDPIPPNSPAYQAASDLRIAILGDAGRDAAALAVARDLSQRANASSDVFADYADLLSAAGRNAEAAQVYGKAIDKAGTAADWTLYLRQGSAYDQAGDWAKARPLIVKAVGLAPDQPLALNYLGYGDIEHGGDIAAATAMLARAKALKPTDPAITDSLGWAYLKDGKPRRALPLLQAAAQDSPADATVNDHLGDALWTVGRRWEARYAWRAALIVANGDDAKRIAAKIASGLPRGK